MSKKRRKAKKAVLASEDISEEEILAGKTGSVTVGTQRSFASTMETNRLLKTIEKHDQKVSKGIQKAAKGTGSWRDDPETQDWLKNKKERLKKKSPDPKAFLF